MNKYILFLGLVISAITVSAEESVIFDVKGLKIGDKLTEKFSYRHCPFSGLKKLKAGSTDIDCRGYIDKEADIFAVYLFRRNKFHNILITFPPNKFKSIVKAYSGKFKVAPKLTALAMKNNFNKSFSVPIAKWETKSGTFKIQKYISSTQGLATLEIPDPKINAQDDALIDKL